MPSFDITSEVDGQEIRNAVDHEAFWWMLEPDGDVTTLSELGMLPYPLSCCFPLERSPFFLPETSE